MVRLCAYSTGAVVAHNVEAAVFQAQHKSLVWSTGTYGVLQFTCQLELRCMPLKLMHMTTMLPSRLVRPVQRRKAAVMTDPGCHGIVADSCKRCNG